jgi:DNA-binding transcriptional LysR family regulator
MEMRQLRHFLALMETRSYWRAADSCGITAQALSKSIRRFEEQLGVRLFDRDTRSVRPTLFAEQIANYARNIDAEARSLRRSLDMLLGAGTNQLVVGAGAAAATKIVVEAVLAVRARSPAAAVTVLEGTYEAMVPLLMNGKLDVVVSIMTTDVVDKLIDHRVLQIEQYRVYARAGHPLAGLARVPLARLLDFPWIAGADQDRVSEDVAASFLAAGLDPPIPEFRTDSVSFAINLVTQCNALFILPAETVRRDVASGQLVAIDVEADRWTRPTVVFYRKNSTRSPDSILFLRELKRIVERNAS